MQDPEERVASLLGTIEVPYIRLNRHAPLSELGIGGAEAQGHHLEFDGLCVFGTVAAFVEVTGRRSKPSQKVRSFLANLNRIWDRLQSDVKSTIQLLSDDPENLPALDEVGTIQALFIGLAPEYRTLSPETYSDAPSGCDLTILDDGEFAYLESLIDVKAVARNELFAKLKLSPTVVEPRVGLEARRYPALRVPRRRLGRDVSGADVYLTFLTGEDLLVMARTIRYQGIPLVGAGGDGASGYQRPLDSRRLEKIAEVIDSTFTFPNTVTVLLGREVRFEPMDERPEEKVARGMLELPYKYGILDVVDGQHRIFSFALESKVEDTVRRGGVIGVTAIQLPNDVSVDREQVAARLFIDINREQRRVGSLQLKLMAYDVLGDRSVEAVTAKVLRSLNLDQASPFSNLLRTEIYRSPTGPSIPPLTVIQEAGVALRRMHEKAKGDEKWRDSWRLGNGMLERVGVDFARAALQQIGSVLHSKLRPDWGHEDSRLMYSKPLAAAVRFSGVKAEEEGMSPNDLREMWSQIATSMRRRTGGKVSDLIFPHDVGDRVGGREYPDARRSVRDFMDLFDGLR